MYVHLSKDVFVLFKMEPSRNLQLWRLAAPASSPIAGRIEAGEENRIVSEEKYKEIVNRCAFYMNLEDKEKHKIFRGCVEFIQIQLS